MVYCYTCVEMGLHFDTLFATPDDISMSDTSSWWKHHADIEALLESAESGCELCALIIEAVPLAIKRTYLQPGRARKDQIYVREQQLYSSSERLSGASRLYFVVKGRVIAELEIFCEPDDFAVVKRIITGRPVGSKFADAITALPPIWIENCLSSHPSCSGSSGGLLPKRVMDVGVSENFVPFVFETNGQSGEWLVLSHCWGGNIEASTKECDMKDGRRVLHSIPQNFIDATYITRKLGFRYLWIDSLCILQDSTIDNNNQLPLMGNIYKNSTIMIVATAAEDSERGILGPRKTPLKCLSLPYESRVRRVKGTLYFRQPPYVTTRGPLTTRAWTLQEKVLSPRTLHFTSETTIWDCRTCFETEGEPVTSGIETPGLKLHQRENGHASCSEMMILWYQMVKNYAERNLSDERDKLNAISALAREVASQTLYTYRVGMWYEDMQKGLLWHVVHGEMTIEAHVDIKSGRMMETTCKLGAGFVGPSWSWVSAWKPAKILTLCKTKLHRETTPDEFSELNQHFGGRFEWEVKGFARKNCLPLSDIDVFAAPDQKIWLRTKESKPVDRHILTSVSSIKYSTFRHHVPTSLDAKIMDWSSQYDFFNCLASSTLTVEGYIHSANSSIWQSHRKSSAELRISPLEDYSSKPAPAQQVKHLHNVVCAFDKHIGTLYPSFCPTFQSQEDVDLELQDLDAKCVFFRICICSWEFQRRENRGVMALLLEPTGEIDEYRRRGIAVIPETDGNHTEGWKGCLVKIV